MEQLSFEDTEMCYRKRLGAICKPLMLLERMEERQDSSRQERTVRLMGVPKMIVEEGKRRGYHTGFK